MVTLAVLACIGYHCMGSNRIAPSLQYTVETCQDQCTVLLGGLFWPLKLLHLWIGRLVDLVRRMTNTIMI